MRTLDFGKGMFQLWHNLTIEDILK